MGELDVEGTQLFKEGGVFGEAFRGMVSYMQGMSKIAEAIAGGDLTVAV